MIYNKHKCVTIGAAISRAQQMEYLEQGCFRERGIRRLEGTVSGKIGCTNIQNNMYKINNWSSQTRYLENLAQAQLEQRIGSIEDPFVGRPEQPNADNNLEFKEN